MIPTLVNRVCGIAADVLEIPAATVDLTSSPETIDTWDSVHHLNLVLALEQEFDLQFEPEEIEQMKDLQHIVAILRGKAKGDGQNFS